MKAYHSLPKEYRKILYINLQEDKKTAVKINVGAIIAMIALFIAGKLIMSGAKILDMGLIKWIILAVTFLIYMVLHELTHAMVMKAVGGGKVIFGFTGMYAFAGSKEDYFDKSAYRLIALAPLVIWGIIFGILAFTVSKEWFWVIWFLQIGNISGAAGDVYVTVRFWNEPASILVMDTGINITVLNKY